MPPVRAVVFDAYGTLLDVHAAVRRHAGRIGPRAEALSALWRQRQLEYTWVMSLAGEYEAFDVLTARALDHALAAEGIEDAALRGDLLTAYRALDAYPDAAPALEALHRAGIATAILSNGEPEMLAAGVAAAGLAPLLDAVLSVHPLRRYKPDPAVYGLVLSRFGGDEDDIAFVSGNAWDAYGAARFGFRVHWLTRDPVPVEYGLHARAAARIASLAELPGLLAA